MDDLIYRQDAIDALTDTNLKRNVDSVFDGDMNRARRSAQRVIAQLPTIDAVEVVHGEWEVVDATEPRRYGCSVCRKLSFDEPNYCSYCGAKMDGEVKNDD